MRVVTGIIIAAALIASGCATKRYPIATPLAAAEYALLDCRELQLEMVRAEQVRAQIADTAETDWRSIAGFLGDYGIGNVMARGEADRAVNERVMSIHAAQAQRGCANGQVVAAARGSFTRTQDGVLHYRTADNRIH